MGKIHSLDLFINGLKYLALNRLNRFTFIVGVNLHNTLALKVLEVLGSEEMCLWK